MAQDYYHLLFEDTVDEFLYASNLPASEFSPYFLITMCNRQAPYQTTSYGFLAEQYPLIGEPASKGYSTHIAHSLTDHCMGLAPNSSIVRRWGASISFLDSGNNLIIVAVGGVKKDLARFVLELLVRKLKPLL